MSWLYLPEQVGDCSEVGCWDGEQSATSKTMPTASKCSNSGSQMGCSTTPRSGMMSTLSTGIRGLDLWISSLRDSRANRSASPGTVAGQTTSETAGLPRSASFAKYDHDTRCWRMYQLCAALFGESHPISARFSATWPRAGMTRGGIVFRLRPLVPITRGTASGSLLPTPRAADAQGSTYQYDRGDHTKPRLTLAGLVQRWPTPCTADRHGRTGGGQGRSLRTAVALWPTAMFPTPTARDWCSGKRLDSSAGFAQLSDQIGGTLNPPWVEWVMNWPIGWTCLKPLGKEYFDDWKYWTQGGATDVHGGQMRNMWWDNDPAETPYRPRSHQQRATECADSMPGVPQEYTHGRWDMGMGHSSDGNVQDLRDGVSSNADPQICIMRQSAVPPGAGETISRVTMECENRVSRIRALGNGQVPAVVAAVWRLLGPGGDL